MAKQFLMFTLIMFAGVASADELPNPLIDYDAFKTGVSRVGEIRESRRVNEFEFMLMAGDRATVILDARSRDKFERLHVKGARNLSFPDITAEELAKIIPSRATRVLIYCNNNFLNEPGAFPAKNLGASLNVYTFNALYAYGYKNVYELGPLLDIRKTRIPFERKSTQALAGRITP